MGNSRNELTDDDMGLFQLASNSLLVAAANGEIDLKRIAHETLAHRGLDHNGEWVGFEKAREIFDSKYNK